MMLIHKRENVRYKAVWEMVLLLILYTIISICMLCSPGCQSWGYDHIKYDAEGNITSHVRAKGSSQFMESNIDNVEVVISDDQKLLSIGEVGFTPDDKSVKAVTEGVVEGLGHIVKP